MRVEDLADALGAIDPLYVQEAERRNDAKQADAEKIRHRLTWGMMRFPVAACFCLMVAGSAFGIWRYGSLGSEDGTAGGMESAAENRADIAEESAATDSAGMTEGNAEADGTDIVKDAAETGSGGYEIEETQIIVHEVEELSATYYDIAGPVTEQYFTAEELKDYYGVRILPKALPKGLPAAGELHQEYAIAYGEDGEVLSDNIKIAFANGDRELTISLRTMESGEVISFAEPDLETSVIAGRNVTIGHYSLGTGTAEEDGYLAIFEKGGVTFTLQSRNLSKEEFLSVLMDLMQD